jgi:hypothetical protein
MRSHLGVLALEKPGTSQPQKLSGEVGKAPTGDLLLDSIPDLRAKKSALLNSHKSSATKENSWNRAPSPMDDESAETLPKPEKLPNLDWRSIIRHTSIIIAIPVFTLIMATLYSRGLFKASEPPGTWLLMVRQHADQDWCFHAIVVLFFISAILMVGKKLTYGFYVLSVAWSGLFIRNL